MSSTCHLISGGRPAAGVQAISDILIITSRLHGRRKACAELTRRLFAAGHNITLAGPDVAGPDLGPAEAKHVVLPDFRLGGPKIAKPRSLKERLPAGRRRRIKNCLNSLPLCDVRSLLNGRKFDLVLIDFELHPHIILSLSAGQKTALFTTMFINRPSVTTPPLDQYIVPGLGARGSRAGIAWAWLKLWSRKWMLNTRKRLRNSAGTYSDVLMQLAENENVDIRNHTTRWYWQYPLAWHKLPLLVMQAKELDFAAQQVPAIRYIGPLLGPPDPDERDSRQLYARIKAARQKGQRIVYIGFGSILPPDTDLIHRIWRAVAKRPDWFVVHTLGNSDARLPDMAPPQNVEVHGWVNQISLLSHADVAITRSGVNTLGECVQAGVPMVCFLTEINDMPGNAARLKYHGLGTVLFESADQGTILSTLESMMEDAERLVRFDRMRAAFDVYLGDHTAESEIEKIIRER